MTTLEEVSTPEGAKAELVRITGDNKIWKWRLDNGSAYLRVWYDNKGYHVDYSALKNESIDDDCGVMMCGCPLQARCHFHKHSVYTNVIPAAKGLSQAAQTIMNGKNVEF